MFKYVFLFSLVCFIVSSLCAVFLIGWGQMSLFALICSFVAVKPALMLTNQKFYKDHRRSYFLSEENKIFWAALVIAIVNFLLVLVVIPYFEP
jgi:uncharacterized membrane protein